MPDLLERLKAALTDRYAVESEIGRGGMATVFLADDLKHNRKVAIKVLHPELASTVGAERFLREIEIAAGLDHPHILTLLDSGQADGLLYYVMPYVDGESLRERLACEPQLPIEEAIRIAREVADGLGCAHRHGVIHRDIKPANIMLSENHALIADFGVARAVGGEGQALTSTGLAVGTPAYMSPEQASGGEVNPRSDLYALGCVLYEMLAGAPPLTGPTPQATAAMRLTETATALPVIRDTVPEGLDRVTRNLLAKSPADRYAGADKLVEGLDDPGLWAEAKPERWVWKRVGSVAVALALLGFVIFATQWFAGQGSGTGSEVVPQRVAVLPFENRTGDPSLDDLGELAAERITTRLQREEVGEVVPLPTVTAAMTVAGEDPGRGLATATGAGLLVSSDFSRSSDSLTFRIRLTDSRSGTQEGSFDFTSAVTDAPDPALDEISSRLAGGLLLAFSGHDWGWAYRAYPTVEAYRPFREAVDLNMAGKWHEARMRLRSAWDSDTTFALALWFLGGVAYNLRESETGDSIYQSLNTRFRAAMPEVFRYVFDAVHAAYSYDFEGAYRAQRRAVSLEPDNPGYRYHLSAYCLLTNRPHELVETRSETEDRLSDDPEGLNWYLGFLTAAYHMLGDHQAELEAARRLERIGWQNPLFNSYVVARAQAALGRPADLGAIQDRMEGLADTTDRAGRYMLAAGLELRYHGHGQESAEAVRRAVQWFAERPSQFANAPQHQVGHGVALYHSRRWDESALVLESVEPAWRRSVDVLGYLGLLAARSGDVESAADYDALLAQIGREDFGALADTWVYRARIAAVTNRRAEAVAHLKRAFDRGLGYQSSPEYSRQFRFDFEGMADHGPYQELLRPKG